MAHGKRARRALMSQTGVFPLFSLNCGTNDAFSVDVN
jgi:hypothetical protein